jgi:hypothetical protein
MLCKKVFVKTVEKKREAEQLFAINAAIKLVISKNLGREWLSAWNLKEFVQIAMR